MILSIQRLSMCCVACMSDEQGLSFWKPCDQCLSVDMYVCPSSVIMMSYSAAMSSTPRVRDCMSMCTCSTCFMIKCCSLFVFSSAWYAVFVPSSGWFKCRQLIATPSRTCT